MGHPQWQAAMFLCTPGLQAGHELGAEIHSGSEAHQAAITQARIRQIDPTNNHSTHQEIENAQRSHHRLRPRATGWHSVGAGWANRTGLRQHCLAAVQRAWRPVQDQPAISEALQSVRDERKPKSCSGRKSETRKSQGYRGSTKQCEPRWSRHESAALEIGTHDCASVRPRESGDPEWQITGVEIVGPWIPAFAGMNGFIHNSQYTHSFHERAFD